MESFEAFRRKGIFRVGSPPETETRFRNESLKKGSEADDGEDRLLVGASKNVRKEKVLLVILVLKS